MLQKLYKTFNNTYLQLNNIIIKLETKLNIGCIIKAIKYMGLQALKWPFESKNVDKIIANLQQD